MLGTPELADVEDVIIRLETLVSNCFNDDPAMKPLVCTLTKWADQ